MQKPSPQLLEAFTDPAFVVEPNAQNEPVFSLCNSAWFEALGLKPETVYGRSIADVFRGPTGQAAVLMHRKALTAQHPVTYALSLPVRGKICHLQSHLTPIRTADGRLAFVIGATKDVTTLESARATEARYSALAEEIEKFTQALSDRLLPQLNTVGKVTAELRDGFLDLGDGKLQDLTRLEEETRRTESLVRDVLHSARATRLAAQSETFSIHDAVVETMATLGAQNADKLTSDASVITTDRDTLKSMLKTLLMGATLSDTQGRVTPFQVSSSTDSPGMISLCVKGPTDSLSVAVSAYEDPTVVLGTRGQAMKALQDLVRARGGDFFAETRDEGDLVLFTFPGYLGTVDQSAQLSA